MKAKSSEYYLSNIYKNPRKRTSIFLKTPQSKKASVFLLLRRHIQNEIVKKLKIEDTVNLLQSLDPDDATDVLQFFPKDKQEELIKQLREETQNQLSTLLKFDRQTAGGLMELNYILAEYDQEISTVLNKFKDHEKRTGKAPEIIVLKDGSVKGYLPGYELGFSHPGEKVGKYTKKIWKVRHDATYNEVIERFRSHPHNKVVVLEENGSVLGVIYSDDVLKILKENEGSNLYDFAGVHDEEEVNDSASVKIKFRYKWLIINLGTAFLASFVVSLFDETINKNVLLAVYMPIVAGMGGNAGTQTLAIMVRGIALRQINSSNFVKPLIAEVLAGFANGLINGILVFFVVLALNRDLLVATVLAFAMVINLMVAAFFGTVVPVIMKSLKKDPASSATIFITTATDVLGFLAFLGLATLLL